MFGLIFPCRSLSGESEALVAGKLSTEESQTTTAAYAIVSLFAGLILLVLSCILLHKCKNKNKPEESDVVPR